MMDPALAGFARVLADVALGAPRIPVISNATGVPLRPDQATDPRYWVDHVRHPVRFSAGVEHLLSLDNPAFVDMGPGSALGDLIRRHDPAARVFPVLAPSASGNDEATKVARAALGGLWCAGVEVDWGVTEAGERRDPLSLPTYPFQRTRHWRDGEAGPPTDPLEDAAREGLPRGASRGRRGARRHTPVDDPRRGSRPGCPVLRERLGGRRSSRHDAGLRRRLRMHGPEPVRGPAVPREDPGAALAAGVAAGGGRAFRVLHLGSVTGPTGPHNSAQAFEDVHDRVLLDRGPDTGPPATGVSSTDSRFLVVADGLARLEGEAGVRFAEKAAVLGACRDILLELPGVRMRDRHPVRRRRRGSRLSPDASPAPRGERGRRPRAGMPQ